MEHILDTKIGNGLVSLSTKDTIFLWQFQTFCAPRKTKKNSKYLELRKYENDEIT